MVLRTFNVTFDVTSFHIKKGTLLKKFFPVTTKFFFLGIYSKEIALSSAEALRP